MSPFGSMINVGIPAASASSSRTIPSPVLPEPVMPTITPWVVRSLGASSSGCPSDVVPTCITRPRTSPCAWPGCGRAPRARDLHGRRGRGGRLEPPPPPRAGLGGAHHAGAPGGLAELDQVVVDHDRGERLALAAGEQDRLDEVDDPPLDRVRT